MEFTKEGSLMRAFTPLRVAIIGTSGYARIHLNTLSNLHATEQVRLVAGVCINPETDPEALQILQKAGAEIYLDWKEMFRKERDQIDLCVIPTPIHLHELMTIAALEAGMNVLVEKPLAPSLEAIERIRQKEKTSGRLVLIGFQDLFDPAVWEAKKELLKGKIGKIRRIRILGMWPRASSYYERSAWAGRLKLGSEVVFDSPMNNAMAHYLHLAMFWAGGKLKLSARANCVEAELFRAKPIETFDTGAIRIQTDEGIEVMMFATHSCREHRSVQINVDGENGRLEWICDESAEWWIEDKKELCVPLIGSLERRALMWKGILDKLSGGSAPVAQIAHAEAQTRCIEMIHSKSEIVDLPENFKRTISTDSGALTVIPSIDTDFQRCFDSGLLPSEAGLLWAAGALAVPK